MMQKASVGAQIQAVITEADQRVAQAKEEGQQRLAEALAESGEFAAKVAAKQSRTLALAVEEAERRGMERGAVPKGGYVGGPGGQQSSPLTGGRPPSIILQSISEAMPLKKLPTMFSPLYSPISIVSSEPLRTSHTCGSGLISHGCLTKRRKRSLLRYESSAALFWKK